MGGGRVEDVRTSAAANKERKASLRVTSSFYIQIVCFLDSMLKPLGASQSGLVSEKAKHEPET